MTKKHIPKTVRKVSLKFDAILLTKQLMVRKKVHMMNTLLSEDFKKCTRSDRYAEVKLFKEIQSNDIVSTRPARVAA